MSNNDDQIEYWNGATGARWVEHQHRIDEAIRPFGQSALEQLAPQPGQSVLDIGCGAGTTTAQIAQTVGTAGTVVGVDPSEPMLARARELSASYGQAQFLCGDAATRPLTGPFDAAYSRFGVMFFADPVAAFRHIHASLKPGAMLSFVCWQALSVNDWVSRPLQALTPLLDEPPAPPAARKPGPFAFAEKDYVRSILSDAGYQSISIEEVRRPVTLSTAGVAAAVQFCLLVGPGARIVSELPEETRKQAREALAESLTQVAVGPMVQLAGAAWGVTARS